ncbi:DNA-binding domain-containing protein [Paraburkholderia caribensis]|uniref:HvfC/BufC N-terminal domain-containing protein n=1 Tax=Paraburkholderia TaxID=1822464 RepID=UPI001CC743F2|nr:DNA-binding domain-containing protein [Paraburkholderia caribensis]BEU25741.1 DNA-binding domain-containing protein [Paraburkholderia sp. 22B1P]
MDADGPLHRALETICRAFPLSIHGICMSIDGVDDLPGPLVGNLMQNTVMKRGVDALAANFPTVVRLVGEARFDSAARAFVEGNPPADSHLVTYGKEFPEFLRRTSPVSALDYLADMARLDQLWIETHIAADSDSPVVDALLLATMAPEELDSAVFQIHPATRWLWVDNVPAYTIWSKNQGLGDVPEHTEWKGEGALFVRGRVTASSREISLGGCAFLDACSLGLAFEPAVQQALLSEPDMDFPVFLGTLLSAGGITAVHCPQMRSIRIPTDL